MTQPELVYPSARLANLVVKDTQQAHSPAFLFKYLENAFYGYELSMNRCVR